MSPWGQKGARAIQGRQRQWREEEALGPLVPAELTPALLPRQGVATCGGEALKLMLGKWAPSALREKGTAEQASVSVPLGHAIWG